MTDSFSSNTQRPEKSTWVAKLSRRDFLSLTWKSLLGLSGLLGLGGLWRFLSYQTDPAPPTVFDIGPAEDLPTGTRATIVEAEAVVSHNEAGFQALSLVCPHLGCRVDPVDTGFACPCHGSRFGLDGSLERGPADKPMRSLSIQVNEEGNLILDTSGA